MIIIDHTGDTVEPEAVEPVLLKPVPAVRQEKMNYIVFTVIKTERIPCVMVPAVVSVEILSRRTVEHPKSFIYIPDGVGVNEIHNYPEAAGMSRVNQFLQFLRCAEPGGGCEET